MKQLKQLKQTTIRSSYFLIYWKRWPNAKQTGSFSARLSTFEKHTERRGRRGKQHKNEVPGTYIYTYARITCCDVATTREHDVSRIDQGGSEVGFGEPFPLSFFACDGSQGWSRNVGVLSFSSLSVKPQENVWLLPHLSLSSHNQSQSQQARRAVVVVFALNHSFYPTTSAVPPVSFVILHPREVHILWSQWDREKPNAKESR